MTLFGNSSHEHGDVEYTGVTEVGLDSKATLNVVPKLWPIYQSRVLTGTCHEQARIMDSMHAVAEEPICLNPKP